MEIYLPIAEMPVNIFQLLSLGAAAGILSGMFGIGGGFLITPLLIFIGIPPAIAVSSSANQVIAASFSSLISQKRKGNVDFQMGVIVAIGGFIGSKLGVDIFSYLQKTGYIDLVISLCYIFVLGFIGVFMGLESVKSLFNSDKEAIKRVKDGKRKLAERLPLRVMFHKSGVEVSMVMPILIGIFAGILVSVMGIGGGFILVPAMIYMLRMPTTIALGTSLVNVVFTACNVTYLQVIKNQTVDIMLTIIMLFSSVIGAQYGIRIGSKIPADHLKLMMSGLILIIVCRLLLSLVTIPENLYEITLLH